MKGQTVRHLIISDHLQCQQEGTRQSQLKHEKAGKEVQGLLQG